MPWSSNFRSIILRRRHFFLFFFFFFFFFNVKKEFVIGSRKCQIQGGGIFANIFTKRSALQRQMSSGEFFSQLVNKLRLMGSPWTSIFYRTTSLSLFKTDSQKLAGASSFECLTSVIWRLQTTSSVLSRLYSTDTFYYRKVVRCKTNLDWSAGISKWKKKSMSLDMSIFETGRRIFFIYLFFN